MSETLPYQLVLTITLLGFVMIAFFFLKENLKEIVINFFSKNEVVKQAKKIGILLHPHFNTEQWLQNIEKSGWLKNSFGNWSSVHGKIKIYNLKGTFTYKNYQIELLKFYIWPDKKRKLPEIGPYIGLHFNLNKKHPEVDIIFKDSRGLLKYIDYKTVKPKTWDTESQEFNNLYKILSSDNVTNLAALTPDVMAKMVDSGLKLNIEIIENHLLIYTASRFKKGNELKTMLEIGWRIAENLE